MTSMETDVASSSRVVIPGESLFPSTEDLRPGKGTYELHGHIYSSLLGYVYVREDITVISTIFCLKKSIFSP